MRALPPNYSCLTWSLSEIFFLSKHKSLTANTNNPSSSWPHHLYSNWSHRWQTQGELSLLWKYIVSIYRAWATDVAHGLGVALQLEFNQTNLLERPGNVMSKCCGKIRKWAKGLCCVTWPVFFLSWIILHLIFFEV